MAHAINSRFNTERNSSRVHFCPSFQSIMDHSMSSHQLEFLFHSFCDICTFSGTKDEDDYERFIYKEGQDSSNPSTLLVGSLVKVDEGAIQPHEF